MNARSLLNLLAGFSLIGILSACNTTGQIKKNDAERLTFGTVKAQEFDTPGEQSCITLSGTLGELTFNEPLIFGSIGVYHQGKLITGIETDFDGHFQKEIPWDAELPFPEELSLEFSYVGFKSLRYNFALAPGKTHWQFDVKLAEQEPINCYWIPEYYPPIYQQDQLSSGRTFSSDDIRRSPTRGR